MAIDIPRTRTGTAMRIARQLADRLDGHRASGDAFVVSVYGEWGIGKTRCLRDIESHFADELATAIAAAPGAAPRQLVVPVFFDPWQFEHEEHLVVPLLKSIELALRRVADTLDVQAVSAGAQAASVGSRVLAAGHMLREAGDLFGDVAVSMLTGFRFKFAPLKEVFGIEAELAPKDVFDAWHKTAEKREGARAVPIAQPWYRRWLAAVDAPGAAADAAAGESALDRVHERLARRESLYFDMREALERLTRQSQPQLRLVVLIDDLDRCLPEKAIQVLESVKLFLNVSGFSFVLAVDDEVVERGISHRYRDYQQTDAAGATSASAPISGAEYLEKIVHLPVHLQRWTADEAAELLRHQSPQLFGLPAAPADNLATPVTGPARTDAAAAELLALVTRSVPLVPRKLIRLAEALEYQQRQFDELGSAGSWNVLHAARIVILQQLYPALYRHLRLGAGRYWRLFEIGRNAYGDPAVAGGRSLENLRVDFQSRGKLPPGADATTSEQHRAETSDLREQLNLLDLIEQAARQRSAPDPLLLFAVPRDSLERDPAQIGSGLTLEAFARLYIHGVKLTAPRPMAPVHASAAEPLATVRDANRLIAMLTRADTVSRREFLEAEQLFGTRLPEAEFNELLARLAEPDSQARLVDMAWLRDIAAITSPEQLLRLYRERQVPALVHAAEQGGTR